MKDISSYKRGHSTSSFDAFEICCEKTQKLSVLSIFFSVSENIKSFIMFGLMALSRKPTIAGNAFDVSQFQTNTQNWVFWEKFSTREKALTSRTFFMYIPWSGGNRNLTIPATFTKVSMVNTSRWGRCHSSRIEYYHREAHQNQKHLMKTTVRNQKHCLPVLPSRIDF